MPGPYPREFREDVVAVARRRESGVTIKQIATDFGPASRTTGGGMTLSVTRTCSARTASTRCTMRTTTTRRSGTDTSPTKLGAPAGG